MATKKKTKYVAVIDGDDCWVIWLYYPHEYGKHNELILSKFPMSDGSGADFKMRDHNWMFLKKKDAEAFFKRLKRSGLIGAILRLDPPYNHRFN